ncbi:unnamed protein product [Heterobilharzia americana]|nr:unnamed protein product [Heterobilharzia americana]CAH8657534.1 unnamed protein product [Heterobilharzia americana]
MDHKNCNEENLPYYDQYNYVPNLKLSAEYYKINLKAKRVNCTESDLIKQRKSFNIYLYSLLGIESIFIEHIENKYAVCAENMLTENKNRRMNLLPMFNKQNEILFIIRHN